MVKIGLKRRAFCDSVDAKAAAANLKWDTKLPLRLIEETLRLSAARAERRPVQS